MPLPRALVAVGATALALAPAAAPAAAEKAAAHPVAEQPPCGDPGSAAFPISSRLNGGPEAYGRGGAPHGWRLELRNDTGADCQAVHPVAVLVDRGRTLRPGDIHLDFYDRGAERWRPVRFERTDEAENVGVFDGSSPDFPGFAVPARRSVTVDLRLAFAAGAPEGPVTANVTAVQRRGNDGDWVGESDDYTFAIEEGTPEPAEETGRKGAAGHAGDAMDPGAPDRVPARGGDASPSAEEASPPALADTGSSHHLFGIGAAALALLLGGAALMFAARRSGR
ncbi:hypothetical protein WEB32_12695 [Streptomyces netropsis]|uniref:hypothetical protein n=1 Tax=Streptomyces netropsis TaxID=55404 RepID=UPI0030D21E10